MLSKGVGTRFLKHLSFLKGSHSQRRKNQAALPKNMPQKSRSAGMVFQAFLLFKDLWAFRFPRGFFRDRSVLVSEFFFFGTLSRRLSKAKTSSCVWSNAVRRPTKRVGVWFRSEGNKPFKLVSFKGKGYCMHIKK